MKRSTAITDAALELNCGKASFAVVGELGVMSREVRETWDVNIGSRLASALALGDLNERPI
jgi:hypothetical protein